MNSLKPIENRHMIPRWQSLSDAVNSAELLHYKKTDKSNNEIDISNEVLQAKKAWVNEKNVFAAMEYLQKQKLNKEELDFEAVSYVKKEISNNSSIPIEIKRFFGQDCEFEKENLLPKDAISDIRKRIPLNYDNAYLWLELARNYLVLGNLEKCEKTLSISRTLAPNDRYIARAMMKFYHHTKNIDKALYYVQKMENLYKDPLLLSGKIALENVIGRTSSNIKIAKSIIESQNYSPVAISELTSEIGTIEIMHGKERVGKRLLASTIDNLTENSFAQVAWINQNIITLPWINDIYSNTIANNYEGKIYLNLTLDNKIINWTNLYKQCKSWNIYQPFSRSPICLGGVIATDFMENPQEGFNFSLSTLDSHKNDSGILNNLAYSAILNNDQTNAEVYLKRQEIQSKTDEDIVLFYATQGLFECRFGSIELGKELYKKACAIAKGINRKLYLHVLIYFYRELSIINDFNEKEIIKNEIQKYKSISNDFMFIQLMKKFKVFD